MNARKGAQLLSSLALAFASACTSSSANNAAQSTAAATAAPGPQAGVDLQGMDKSVAPGDDFYAYTNGTWLKTTEIAADRSTAGRGADLTELTTKRTVELISDAAKGDAPAGSDARKVGDYYASFMDEATIESKGLSPLQPTLDRVAAIADAKGLAHELGNMLRADVDVLNASNLNTDNLFGLWVAQDLNDPSKYSPFLLQGGLGMPDRDYYLSDSPRMAALREKYQAHIAAVLKLANVDGAEAKAKRIFEHEKKIAQTHAPRIETGDVMKGNNHWSRADFDTKAPGLDWAEYFQAGGLAGQKEFVVWQPSAFVGSSALVKSQPLAVWKEYLAYRHLEKAAAFLPKAFVDERFDFYGKALAGTPKLADRWKRGVAATDAALGEVVGKLYVGKYFPPSEKARAEAMVKNVLIAFGKRIDSLEWMAPATKEKAKAKLAVLKVGVGYPDKWRDYSGLEVIRGDALGNAWRASRFETQQKLKWFGGPVDRGEWVMNAQLVNAVNLPAMNALNFPAAFLQPPAFDPNRPAVMDYGSIGSVIGHEICHSFDDQGALFDADGRLKDWWTKEDYAHFKASSEALIAQYNGYKPFPDLSVNGALTVGENIADVAGLLAAYDAYRLSLGGKEAPEYQGLTGDQQFFISFAQNWRSKIREPALRARIQTDGHAPAEYRGDTVRNLDAWYPAFDVKPGQKLYLAPNERVRVW